MKEITFKEQKALVEHLTRPLQDAADALTELAESFRLYVELERQRFNKEFPHLDIKPASVGVAKYPEPAKDKPEEEGDVFPEESSIGHREAKIIARASKRLPQVPPRRRS